MNLKRTTRDWERVRDEAFAVIRSGEVKPTASAIGKHFDIPSTTISNAFARLFDIKSADLQAIAGQKEPEPELEENKNLNTWEISSTIPRITTLPELLDYMEVDLDVWEVERHVANKWEFGNKYGEIFPLFQVKAWLKRKQLIANFPHIQPIQVDVKIPKPRKTTRKGVKRELILADPQTGFRRNVHTGKLIPFHDRRVLDIALQLLQYQKFDGMTLLGDDLDFSEWTTKFLIEPEFMFTTMPALLELHWWLTKYRLAAPDAVIDMIQGNHDRIMTAIMTHLKAAYSLRPVDELELPPSMSMERLLALHKLNIGFIGDYPKGSKWLNDFISLIHGHIARGALGATASGMLQRTHHTTVYGHIHRREMLVKKMLGKDGEYTIFTAFCPGCACHIDGRVPGKKTDENWTQGLGIIEYTDDAHHIIPIEIENGQAIYDGRIFTSNRGDDDKEINAFIDKGLSKISD